MNLRDGSCWVLGTLFLLDTGSILREKLLFFLPPSLPLSSFLSLSFLVFIVWLVVLPWLLPLLSGGGVRFFLVGCHLAITPGHWPASPLRDCISFGVYLLFVKGWNPWDILALE